MTSSRLTRHFFKEFTDDYPARYQWRKFPTTGAYDIFPEGIKKGRSITLTRLKNWWARDKKHYRYRLNPDFIEYRVVGSMDKTWEMFRQGQIDWFALGLPRYWYDKSEVPEFYNGYIERQKFFNDFPRISRGIYINQSKPLLDNLDVRIGIAHALNFQKVIDVDFRGDYTRMQSTFAGFGRFTNPNVKARPFDVPKAREHFAKAGRIDVAPECVFRRIAGRDADIDEAGIFEVEAHIGGRVIIDADEIDALADGGHVALAHIGLDERAGLFGVSPVDQRIEIGAVPAS